MSNRKTRRKRNQKHPTIADQGSREYKLNESNKGGLSISRVRTAVKQDMGRRIREDRKANGVHPEGSHPESACLSSAVCKYMCTLADPTLDMLHAGPIPRSDPPPGPVSMQRFKVRGQAWTGGSNFGFIAVAPGYSGPYGDRSVVSLTNNSYPSNIVDLNLVAPDVTELSWRNTPYNATGTTTDQLQFRCTGCQVRIRNVTNVLNKGGQLTVLEAQAHEQGYFQGKTYNQIASNPRARTFNLSEMESGWISLNWHPTSENSNSSHLLRNGLSGLDFTHQLAGVAAPSGSSIGSELIVAFSGVSVTTPQAIEFEVYSIYELKGTLVKGKTEYPRDSEGWGYASTAISEIKSRSGEEESPDGNPIARMGKLIRYYVKETAEAAEEVIPLALNVYKMFGG